MEQKKKTTSLKISPDLWKAVKKRCIDREIEVSIYIEELIKKDLETP
jgi:hypothetical protein